MTDYKKLLGEHREYTKKRYCLCSKTFGKFKYVRRAYDSSFNEATELMLPLIKTLQDIETTPLITGQMRTRKAHRALQYLMDKLGGKEADK